ncbi:MAG: trypsin-like peptidase domain-containing protein [Rubrobacteraceae bacterium]
MTQAVEPRKDDQTAPEEPDKRKGARLPYRLISAFLAGMLLVSVTGGAYIWTNPPAGGAVTAAPIVQASAKGSSIDAAKIYKADAPGVVQVETRVSGGSQGLFGTAPGQGAPQGPALGSGFVVDGQGRILTNYHVVDGASKITVTLYNEKSYGARLVGSDPSSDLAVLKINAPADALTPLPLGDSSKLDVGQPVVAIGNPLGYSDTETQGIVSAIGRDIQAPNGFTITGAIQTDAPLTNGNSGGPLIDASGQVVGINSQVARSQNGTSQADGIGFAVPINTAKDALGQLDRTGNISHPYLGISGIGITPELSKLFPVDRGVAVAAVVPGGPADKAGLRGGDRTVSLGGAQVPVGGDVILGVDGKSVSDMGQLQQAISKDKVGQTVVLKVRQGSQTTQVRVTLDNQPANPEG